MNTALMQISDNRPPNPYGSEGKRISSYSTHISRFENYSISAFVKDGFFNTQRGCEIQCYSCGYRHNLDTETGDPIANHRRRVPLCDHLKQQSNSNGFSSRSNAQHHQSQRFLSRLHPAQNQRSMLDDIDQHQSLQNTGFNSLSYTEGNRDIDVLSSALRSQRIRDRSRSPDSRLRSHLQTLNNGNARTEQLRHSTSASRGSPATFASAENLVPFVDYRLERCRLQSFKNWPNNAAATPADLANAGFRYLGTDDRVECVFCKGILRCWEPEDRALAEHMRHFPHCPFLEDPVAVGNVPLGEETEGMMATVQMRNNAGDVSHLSGVMMDRPVNPRFANVAERLSSFDNYPSNTFQEPSQLAHSGFFYTGHLDTVKCFFCNTVLQNWQEHHDPWVQHAKSSSKCGFVLLNKGEEYVKRALQSKDNKIKHKHPTKTKVKKGIKHKVSKDKLDQLMASSMVKSVLEIGSYEEELVRAVIQNRLEELGEQFPNAEALGDGITDHLEYIENNDEGDSDEMADISLDGAVAPKPNTTRTTSPVPDPTGIFESCKDTFVCKVCLDKMTSIVFLKCGHLVCCNSCAPELTKCPICRENILGTICVDMEGN